MNKIQIVLTKEQKKLMKSGNVLTHGIDKYYYLPFVIKEENNKDYFIIMTKDLPKTISNKLIDE